MPAKLVYSCIVSLDGYTNDASGNFDWAAPSAEVHAFVNDQERSIGTYLVGRRMYETMLVWETMEPGLSPEMDDYATIWRAIDKVVFSSTLAEVTSARTTLERNFDPVAIQGLKDAATADISIGGPHLAAHAIRAGLVDEYWILVCPIIVGGGTPFLPDGVRVPLELLESRTFDGGVVHLRYGRGL